MLHNYLSIIDLATLDHDKLSEVDSLPFQFLLLMLMMDLPGKRLL